MLQPALLARRYSQWRSQYHLWESGWCRSACVDVSQASWFSPLPCSDHTALSLPVIPVTRTSLTPPLQQPSIILSLQNTLSIHQCPLRLRSKTHSVSKKRHLFTVILRPSDYCSSKTVASCVERDEATIPPWAAVLVVSWVFLVAAYTTFDSSCCSAGGLLLVFAFGWKLSAA